MRNQKVRSMVLSAMFIGLMALMTFIPQIGFIQITPVIAFTLLHIPVLVGAYLFGWKYGLVLGFAFGFLSFLRALISPTTVLDAMFVNPLISIVPRVLFGFAAGFFFELLRKFKSIYVRWTFVALSSALLTLLHSTLVLTMLGLFEASAISTNYWVLMGTIIGTNGVSEAVVAFIIVPLICFALLKASGQKTIEKVGK